MRFVPIKTLEQQALLCLHRVRQRFIEERTATINRLRGLLAEFCFVMPQKAAECRFSDSRDPSQAVFLRMIPPFGVRISQNLSPL
jgi:transposase